MTYILNFKYVISINIYIWIKRMNEADKAQLQKQRIEKINKIFLIVDTILSAISLLISLITIPNLCSMSLFLLYTIYFMGQSIQHFLMLKMPKIDALKYDKIIKRYVYIVSIIEIIYFFFIFMFLAKTQIHPFYCFFCVQLGISSIIGLALIIHFILSFFTYIQFIYKYINRKYYLLALGGFEVQLRMNLQREQNLRRAASIEPYYNQYPVINEELSKRQSKFYKFQDIKQDVEGEKVCSICLTKEKQGYHPIFTSCRHYFHRECIENWAKINGKCPQCRATLQQQNPPNNNQQKEQA